MNEKLADSNTATESYWTISNHLLFNKKLVTIPTLLVDGTFTSDFSEKAYIFNNFFASIEQRAGLNPSMLLKTIY